MVMKTAGGARVADMLMVVGERMRVLRGCDQVREMRV